MRASALQVAISSCPNDTFCFQPWAEGVISSPYPVQFSFYDIERLNILAKTKKFFDVTKLSTACLNEVEGEYVHLTSGAAFAIGGGPKLVAKQLLSLKDFSKCTIAIPGRHTSGYVAMTLLYGHPEKIVEMPSTEIMKSVLSGQVDAGLVIHEARFVHGEYGLVEIVDIGDAYQDRFLEPLPLGVIAARRSFGSKMLSKLSSTLCQSIQKAKERSCLSPFVTNRAQEFREETIWQHIRHFVTIESETTTEESSQWIHSFLERIKKVR